MRLLTSSIVALLVVLTTIPPALADRVKPSIYVTSHVNVRAEASSTSPLVGTLSPGETAELLSDTGPRWRLVELADGTRGYVSKIWTVRVAEAAAVPPGELVVTFIDVGQGDAILLQVDDIDILVDAGTEASWSRNLERSLASVDGALELLLVTHPHDDHFGAAKAVLGAFQVLRVITNGERRGPPRDPQPLARWSAFEQAVTAEGLTLDHLAVGDVLTPAPGLRITVLATGSPAGGLFPDTPDGADINDDSLVLLVEYGGRRILLTGDIETDADRHLVQTLCASGDPANCPALRADVLKVPHHGSADFDPAFLEAVDADFAVISADHRNRKHCLPRKDSVDALHAAGARIYSTSGEGQENVVLVVKRPGGELTWRAPTKPVFHWEKQPGQACQERTFSQGQ